MGKKRGLVEAEEAAAVPPHHQQQHPCDDKVKGDTNIKRQEAKDAGELKKKKKIKKLKLKATTTSEVGEANVRVSGILCECAYDECMDPLMNVESASYPCGGERV